MKCATLRCLHCAACRAARYAPTPFAASPTLPALHSACSLLFSRAAARCAGQDAAGGRPAAAHAAGRRRGRPGEAGKALHVPRMCTGMCCKAACSVLPGAVGVLARASRDALQACDSQEANGARSPSCRWPTWAMCPPSTAPAPPPLPRARQPPRPRWCVRPGSRACRKAGGLSRVAGAGPGLRRHVNAGLSVHSLARSLGPSTPHLTHAALRVSLPPRWACWWPWAPTARCWSSWLTACTTCVRWARCRRPSATAWRGKPSTCGRRWPTAWACGASRRSWRTLPSSSSSLPRCVAGGSRCAQLVAAGVVPGC